MSGFVEFERFEKVMMRVLTEQMVGQQPSGESFAPKKTKKITTTGAFFSPRYVL